MYYKIIAIPCFNGQAEEDELNALCAQYRVVSVEKEFVSAGIQSYWSFCITYFKSEPSSKPKRSKIDYREILSSEDFDIYSILRDLRKKFADEESIPVYAIFTNEQLASMVTKRVTTKSQLLTIEGVGSSKVEKYGAAFLQRLQAKWIQESNLAE